MASIQTFPVAVEVHSADGAGTDVIATLKPRRMKITPSRKNQRRRIIQNIAGLTQGQIGRNLISVAPSSANNM